MTGCDKIEILRENGVVTIKFKRDIPAETLAIYNKLGVKPSFDCEMPLVLIMSEAEYEKFFSFQHQVS